MGIPHQEAGHRNHLAGFSLVELIATLIIVGILAIVALPRFANKSSFDARGAYDQSIALLRYAQKMAIAQGGGSSGASPKQVYAVMTSTSITLCYVAACGVGNLVPNPAGGTNGASYTLPSGYTYSFNINGTSPVTATLSFNGLGEPYYSGALTTALSTVTITGAGATQNLYVEQETGYVHS